MEEELLISLDRLKIYKNKYRQLKSFVVELQEEHEQKETEMKKIMRNMKHQIQDANKIEERMDKSLKEKQLICEKMEAELVHFRKELDAKFIQTRMKIVLKFQMRL